MKTKAKYCAAIASVFAFAAFAQAQEDTVSNVYGGTSKRVQLVSEAGKPDLVLNPNREDPTAEAFFSADSNKTFRSITTTGNPSLWNIALGKATIDIAQSGGGEFMAFANNGTMSWNVVKFDVVNSAGSDATALLDLGTLSLRTNDDGLETWLTIGTRAKVSGILVNTWGEGTEQRGICITNNADVTYNVSETAFGPMGRLKVDGGSTLNVKGKLTFNGAGSKLTLGGTMSYDAVAAGQGLTLRDASITGTLITKGGVGSNLTLAGATTLSGNGIINANGAIIIDSGSLTVSDNGKISIVDDKTYDPRIRMGGGTLTLNAENAVQVNSTRFNFANIVVYGDNGSRVVVNEDNKFRLLYFQSNHDITLDVAEDATVFFEQIGIGSGGGGTLLIENFGDERIFFASSDNWGTISISATDKNGKTFTKDELKLVAGRYIDGTSGYWLNAVVPEPSTYAMIFGAIALGFAAYRRRK